MSGDVPATTFPRRDFLKAGGALLVGSPSRHAWTRNSRPGCARGAVYTGSRPARYLDRHSRRQHGDDLPRLCRARPGEFDRVAANRGRGARPRHVTGLDGSCRDGQVAEPGRNECKRIDQSRRTANPPRGGGCAAGPPGPRLGAARRAGRAPHRQPRSGVGRRQSRAVGHLWCMIGDRRFDVPYTGKAPVKDYRDHRIVGASVPRNDIPAKASGTYVTCSTCAFRNAARPRGAPTRSRRVRRRRPRPEPGHRLNQRHSGARVVRRRDFVGVVASEEWNAVRAARQLRVTGTSRRACRRHPRRSSSDARREDDRLRRDGSRRRRRAFAAARHVVSHRFDSPYQITRVSDRTAPSRTSKRFGVVMCSTQGPYATRAKIADVLQMNEGKITVRYYEGSGTFGAAATTMWRRPRRSCRRKPALPSACSSCAGTNMAGTTSGRRTPRREDRRRCQRQARRVRISRVAAHVERDGNDRAARGGTIGERGQDGRAQSLSPTNTGEMYALPHWRIVNHRVPGLHGYFKAAPLRSPLDLAISFGAEQVIDELAYLANMDPYLFRRQNMNATAGWRC